MKSKKKIPAWRLTPNPIYEIEGQWHYEHGDTRVTAQLVKGKGTIIIAMIRDYPDVEPVSESTAARGHLIAAAPQLLHACREGLSLLEKLMPMAPDRDYQEMTFMRDAITAATKGAKS
jgi:hypothetical protein